MLYHICENEPKIPILTFISDQQGKTVSRGGMAKGGQEGLPLRPIRQVKATPGGRKKGAKSLLGSNRFGKVALEIFLFSACTLLSTLEYSDTLLAPFDTTLTPTGGQSDGIFSAHQAK